MADETTRTYHITFDDAKNQWCVRAEENSRANKYFSTKDEAEKYAKKLVANNPDARIVFHKKDGRFQKSHRSKPFQAGPPASFSPSNGAGNC